MHNKLEESNSTPLELSAVTSGPDAPERGVNLFNIALNPLSFSCIDLAIRIERYQTPTKDEGSDINIRNCLFLITRVVKRLARYHKVKQATVVGAAIKAGTKFLLSTIGNDISRIDEAFDFVFENCPDDLDLLQRFESGFFDFKNTETRRYHNRCCGEDASICQRIAETMGLSEPVVYQVAIMAGLMTSKNVPVWHNNRIADIVSRFIRYADKRAKQAEQMRMACDKADPVKLVGSRKTLDDTILEARMKRTQ